MYDDLKEVKEKCLISQKENINQSSSKDIINIILSDYINQIIFFYQIILKHGKICLQDVIQKNIIKQDQHIKNVPFVQNGIVFKILPDGMMKIFIKCIPIA